MVKLVSEIVAVVLIVAVTVGIALLVGYFISNYISKRQAEISSYCFLDRINNKVYAKKINDTHISLNFEYNVGTLKLENLSIIVYCNGEEIFNYKHDQPCNVGCFISKDVETNCTDGLRIMVFAKCENAFSNILGCGNEISCFSQ
ncbi:MAG: hypothetical protein QXQ14_00785 [Candidatus Aenigmatarchaeota archaeon]